MLATIKDELGELSRVKRFVRILGMVNATEDFTAQPQVINGFSELMVVAFGEDGKAARAAVGMASLPSNIAVEIEAIVELHDFAEIAGIGGCGGDEVCVFGPPRSRGLNTNRRHSPCFERGFDCMKAFEAIPYASGRHLLCPPK